MNDHSAFRPSRTHHVGCLFAALLLVLGCSAAHAAVQAAQLFADHMVMQRDIAVPVWGWAEAGEAITVTIDGQEQKAVAGADGRWMVRLTPLHVGAPRTMTITGRQDVVHIADILIGDVWICSGQSNMMWTVQNAQDGTAEVAQARHPELRFFEVTNPKSPDQPLDRMDPTKNVEQAGPPLAKCQWRPCDPAVVPGMSAVGYYFGRQLQHDLGIPIGLILNPVGATAIEAWMSRESLAVDPVTSKSLEYWKKLDAFAESDAGKAQLQQVFTSFNEQLTAAVKEHKWVWRSDKFQHPRDRLGHPSTFFNGRVNPLIPFAIAGVIWYQGEANTSNGMEYRDYFRVMITDWRARWGQGDFPFLFVQLANCFRNQSPDPFNSEWAELRESQASALALKRTGMAVAIDIGEAGSIHPKNKQEVGRRLALAAHRVAYNEPIVASGPLYKAMTIDGGRATVTFDSIGGGLVAKGGPLHTFEIAGDDHKFVRADAVISGETVVVSSPQVPHPLAVRYAWSHNPEGCNLYNQEGLPAPPFRSDTWKGVTNDRGYAALLAKPLSFTAK